jgi:hypothetical protein
MCGPALARRIEDRLQVAAYRRNLGVVFQDYKLLEHRTYYEQVAFALTVTGRRKEAPALVLPALARVGLPDVGDRYPEELSGGAQQRVAIARPGHRTPGRHRRRADRKPAPDHLGERRLHRREVPRVDHPLGPTRPTPSEIPDSAHLELPRHPPPRHWSKRERFVAVWIPLVSRRAIHVGRKGMDLEERALPGAFDTGSARSERERRSGRSAD